MPIKSPSLSVNLNPMADSTHAQIYTCVQFLRLFDSPLWLDGWLWHQLSLHAVAVSSQRPFNRIDNQSVTEGHQSWSKKAIGLWHFNNLISFTNDQVGRFSHVYQTANSFKLNSPLTRFSLIILPLYTSYIRSLAEFY